MQRVEHLYWKRTEVARLLGLVEAERRYFQQILAALPVAVAVAGANGALRAANAAFRAMFGLEEDDVARTSVQELFRGSPAQDWLREVAAGGRSIEECELLVGEGESARHFLLKLDPAPDWQEERSGEVLITVLEMRREEDASEPEEEPHEEPQGAPPQAAAAPPPAALLDIERAKRAAIERLSARVAHVANNLLMIIGGYGEEILESLPEGDVCRTGMAEILRAAERLGRITKDLNALTVARDYEPATFSLADWLREHAPGWAGWRVDAEPPEPGLCARTSPELLGCILGDAARYLRQALGDSARLQLRVGRRGQDRVQLRLEWTGADLGSEARERFFEPFSGEKDGSDPPLGVAGHIKSWEKLGGELRLEESAFVIECPLWQEVPAQAPVVLLVEDEPGIRSLIARALEREGFTVTQAGSAQEALEAWQHADRAPSLLITDVTLPGLSGKDLVERLRLRWPELCVLYISGYTADEALAGAAAAGQLGEKTRFLHKPFTTARLVDEVRRLTAL
jgi:PAS domain S-box-containing protein